MLLLIGVSVVGTVVSGDKLMHPLAAWPGMVLSAVAGLSLLWHRSHLRSVLVVTMACAMVEAALGYLLNPLAMTPLIVALYFLGTRAERRTVRNWSVGAALSVMVAGVLLGPSGTPLVLSTVNPMAWAFLPAALGSYVQMRRAYVAEAHARAEHAERTREEEARYRVAQERMRIARDLHDVVAHHLTLANTQAGIASHLARTHPEQSIEMLDNLVGETASALQELKATVGLLREDTDTDSPLEPVPSLDRLPEFTESLAAAGLQVEVRVQGAPCQLPSTIGLTAFRILQEALTNVSKHAQTQAACVHLTYAPDRLTLRVSNDGPRTAAPVSSTGFGLIGMRERAQAVDGTLTAGPRPDGGFDVTCVLPLDPIGSPESFVS
ncbi:sensor histidine kinase [Streptomyces fuscichromogenes]|uniref:histidine kinase n=1 Tax=Streptomyces fuscichromogenes TaxID=1324013 RepID=A0A917XMP6_9ACTN|nr:sensor histidine kinase [Streptomyces fuscichromogenes]GGN40403.1 two-component sensor histidine kinase [Streptomyces fuscichromogenes]